MLTVISGRVSASHCASVPSVRPLFFKALSQVSSNHVIKNERPLPSSFLQWKKNGGEQKAVLCRKGAEKKGAKSVCLSVYGDTLWHDPHREGPAARSPADTDSDWWSSSPRGGAETLTAVQLRIHRQASLWRESLSWLLCVRVCVWARVFARADNKSSDKWKA